MKAKNENQEETRTKRKKESRRDKGEQHMIRWGRRRRREQEKKRAIQSYIFCTSVSEVFGLEVRERILTSRNVCDRRIKGCMINEWS